MRTLFLGLMLLSMGAVAKVQPKPVVLVHGDSLSAAYGMSTEQGWVRLLAPRCGCTAVNSSQSGETTAGGLTRLPAALKLHKPDVLVLELGANDGLRALPLDLVEQNLARMIQLGQASGARVLLVATALPPNMGRTFGDSYRAIFPRLAQRYDLPPPPFLLAGFERDLSGFQSDGLHPLPKMQPILLNNVWPRLAPLLMKRVD